MIKFFDISHVTVLYEQYIISLKKGSFKIKTELNFNEFFDF